MALRVIALTVLAVVLMVGVWAGVRISQGYHPTTGIGSWK